jgi:hypothetical protein
MKNKFSIAMSLAVMMAMLVTSLALADTFTNDVVAGGNDTITAGGSTVITYKINSTGGDGEPGCNVTDGTPATVTITVPAGVSASTTTLTFTQCGNPGQKSVTYSSSTAGNYSITTGIADAGLGTYINNADFTLHVNAPPPPSDTTPPVISYVLTPSSPDGNNGWYKSDVTLTWNVTENESPSSLVTTGCVDQNITADQAETTYSCSATSDGGSAGPVSVSIKRDATAPTVTVTPTRGPDQNGWYNAPVNFDTAGTDATSGVSDGNCTADQNYTGPDGTGFIVGGSCTDNAGNTSNGSSAAFNFDDTNPTLAWNGGPAGGSSHYFGYVPAAPTCTASDATSGPGSCGIVGYGTTVGSHTMTATAYDVAGNSYSETRTYTVLAWTLNGFYNPVDMNGVYNTVRGGSTVPLKFEVFAGSTELSATSVVQSFVQTRIACDGSSPVDDIEFTTTGGTSLRYDTTGGQFIQNWQTPRTAGACYRVTMTTQDGSSLVAFFKLK